MDTYEQDMYNNRDNRMEIMRKRESKTTTTQKTIYQENTNDNNNKNIDKNDKII